MHGFCTDFARFQNVQRVLFAAKSDKGCRNCRVKNYVVLIKNCDDSKLPEIETNRQLALLISGPRVRVPGGAPQQQNPNFFPIGEGFGFFVFFGKQNESLASIEKCPRPYYKLLRWITTKIEPCQQKLLKTRHFRQLARKHKGNFGKKREDRRKKGFNYKKENPMK